MGCDGSVRQARSNRTYARTTIPVLDRNNPWRAKHISVMTSQPATVDGGNRNDALGHGKAPSDKCQHRRVPATAAAADAVVEAADIVGAGVGRAPGTRTEVLPREAIATSGSRLATAIRPATIDTRRDGLVARACRRAMVVESGPDRPAAERPDEQTQCEQPQRGSPETVLGS